MNPSLSLSLYLPHPNGKEHFRRSGSEGQMGCLCNADDLSSFQNYEPPLLPLLTRLLIKPPLSLFDGGRSTQWLPQSPITV